MFPLLAKFNAAYAAALALIIIQVGIGILYKAAQSGGNYSFSASSSVTISEFLKLLLSTYFFYREWLQRREDSIHIVLSSSESRVVRDSLEEKGMCEGEESDLEDARSQDSRASEKYERDKRTDGEITLDTRYWTLGSPVRRDFGTFVKAARDELPVETRYGFVQLALFYVLINNTVFLLFRLADPGTIQLIKSLTTVITALIMMFALNSKITGRQWLAIVLQVCGIVTTQYREGGAAYPLSTYLILLFQTTISAISSVYNSDLMKSVDGSMHVMNMTLYGSGMCLNFILHIAIRCVKWDEPGFFTGYGSWGACMVILSNVFIGLAMTAVYKYADAIIKCFATAISTGVLLYVSPILFNVMFSFLVLPGTCVVFIATWLYMQASPPKPTNPVPIAPTTPSESRSQFTTLLRGYSAKGHYRRAGLSIATTLTVFMIAALNHLSSHSSGEPSSGAKHLSHPPSDNNSKNNGNDELRDFIESPFKNTLAFVRWNSHHPERIPVISSGYTPFFHTVHISMPALNPSALSLTSNLTHDNYEDPYIIYKSLRDTMAHILAHPYDQESKTIDGLLYFHFDTWVHPLRFALMDKHKLWYPRAPEPKWQCMTSTERYGEWWGWGQGYHDQALQGVRLAKNTQGGKYVINPDEWCIGWSDLYYIPIIYFADYIALSDIFLAVPVFHELAIPTMLHIIDRTYQSHPTRSLIETIGDCWGDCCADNPLVEDIEWYRCGHRLNFLNENVTKVHFERLAASALMLGRGIDG